MVPDICEAIALLPENDKDSLIYTFLVAGTESIRWSPDNGTTITGPYVLK